LTRSSASSGQRTQPFPDSTPLPPNVIVPKQISDTRAPCVRVSCNASSSPLLPTLSPAGRYRKNAPAKASQASHEALAAACPPAAKDRRETVLSPESTRWFASIRGAEATRQSLGFRLLIFNDPDLIDPFHACEAKSAQRIAPTPRPSSWTRRCARLARPNRT
jgi:hypothetical protein